MSALLDLVEPPRAARPRVLARPGLVAFAAGYRLLAGLALAAPIAVALHDAVSGYPRGDAELFDPGAVMLLEATRFGQRAAPVIAASLGVPALIAAVVGLVPLAMLIAGLGREGRLSRAWLAGRAASSLGTLALIWGVGLLAQGILGALCALLGGKILDWTHPTSRAETLARAAVGAVIFLVVAVAGVLRDLATVSAVNDGTRFYTSCARALRAGARTPARAFAAWAWRALVAAGAIGAAFAATTSLKGDPAVGLPFLLHESAIVLAVVMRASWLAAAIGFLDRLDPPAVSVVEPVAEPEPVAEAAAVAEVEPVAEAAAVVEVKPVADTEPDTEAAAEPGPISSPRSGS